MITYRNIVEDIFKSIGFEASEEQILKAREVLISDMSDKYKTIEQFMFVEDGSLKEEDIKEIKRRNPEVKIVVYRQGSPAPIIHDL